MRAERDLTAAFSANPRPRDGEAPFEIEELFFSRTDQRGVIQSFNNVFLRVADYEAEQMLGAPHRLIRHPDMPRGVFRLLWDGIQAGHPIAAYVKNRARDGLPYWVLALVTPVPGGYLSVRMKPSSRLFRDVPGLYASLLEREADEGRDPVKAAEAVHEQLRALGFPTYAAFQAHALAIETQARDAALQRAPDAMMQALLDLQGAQTAIAREKSEMTLQIAQMSRVPLNMRIIAARIEHSGGPLSAISDSYRQLSEEVASQLQRLLEAGEESSRFTQEGTGRALFLHCAARLATEAAQSFAAETHAPAGVDPQAEGAELDRLAASYRKAALAATEKESMSAARLLREIASLRRALLAMDSIRILSRVEAGRRDQRHNGLEAIVGTLDAFHAGIDGHLDRVAHEAMRLHEGAKAMV